MNCEDNLENLKGIEKLPNYHFVKGNVLNAKDLKDFWQKHTITDMNHLVSELLVDRYSICD